MRKLTLLAVVLAALVAAVPAQAYTSFNRTITTSCDGGQIYAFNNHTGSSWRTSHPCNEAQWSQEKQTYYYIHRPWTDFEGGDQAAYHWYPNCFHHLEVATDPGDGSYDLLYSFACSP